MKWTSLAVILALCACTQEQIGTALDALQKMQCAQYRDSLNQLYASRSRLSPAQLQAIISSLPAGERLCEHTAAAQPGDNASLQLVIDMVAQ